MIVYGERQVQNPKGFWNFDKGGWMLIEEAKKVPTEPVIHNGKAYRYIIYWGDSDESDA